MATVTTTYFFITDARATDRTQEPSWSPPLESSSSQESWTWSPAPRG